jgi:integrase
MATGNIVERKRKNGSVYEITVEGETDPLTGKRNRVYKTVKGSKREANTVMRQMIADMDKGIALRKSPKNVSEWLDEWVELYLPNVEETTRIGYKTKIRCYLKPAIGDILVQSLRAGHVQKMVNDMLARGLSPKNIRDTFNNINAAMKKAVSLRMIPYNPCEGVVLPKLKRYKAKVYDVNMIHTLLSTAEGTDMYLPIMLCVLLGLRRGELLALRWENVDFENSLLKIRSNMVRGEKDYIIKAPKSEAGIRDLHAGDEVMAVLHEERRKYLEDMLKQGRRFQNLGFVIRQEDGSPLRPDSMSQKWRRFLEEKGLPSIRFHDLRHSNATALIQAGVNPRVVQQRLGHSDVNITLNTYTHVLPEMDIDAAEKLDFIMLKKA